MREDYILLDDDLEIMVIPHLVRDHKWVTYDEIDEMRRHFPRFPRMIFNFNEQESWNRRLEQAHEKSD